MNIRQTVLFSCVILIAIFATLVVWPRAGLTQQDQAPKKQQTPTIDEYQPKSTLVTKEHKIERAKFPFIDIHSHHWNPTAAEVDQLVKEMDKINLRGMVNLRGGTVEQLKNTVAVIKGRYAVQVVVVGHIIYVDFNTPVVGQRVAVRLEQVRNDG